jgi:hypothetical protein
VLNIPAVIFVSDALNTLRRRVPQLCACVAAAVTLAQPVEAHDIPSSATVLMYVKPEAARLVVLLRAPMAAFGEISFPVRGPGYLDLEVVDSALAEVVRVYFSDTLRAFADGEDLGAPVPLAMRVALPSDTSFVGFESALTHVNGAPLGNEIDLFWNQASFDVLLEYAVPPQRRPVDASTRLSLLTATERLASQTLTVLRYLPVDRPERVYNYVGNPGLIHLDPGWWNAVSRFVGLGFLHILDGMDHLLFLLALVIPTRSIRALVLIVTAFTVAHTITLISAALGLAPAALWFPALIETLIALSIFYAACENVLGVRQHYRWMLAYGFGLIHGFGFSFVLADRLQFAGGHLISSLLAFNVGVELGQLLVVGVAVPALWLLFRYVLHEASRERLGIILLSALVGHSAWHWLIQRGSQLVQYSWQRPEINAAFFAAASRWAMLVIGSALVLLALHELVRRYGNANT